MNVVLLRLVLAKVSYRGDSTGDDIRIEIEHPRGLFGLNKKIKHNTEFAPKVAVGLFSVASAVSLTVRIIEQDLVFNDVGSKVLSLPVELGIATPQKSAHAIVVKERRGMLPSARAALFVIDLEATVEPATRYIPLTDDGWFVCKKENQNARIALPAFLRIQVKRIVSGREYFTPFEGAWQGTELWASAEREASLRLLAENPQSEGAHLTYSVSRKMLTLAEETYQTTDAPDARLEKGHYDIEIPDAPHRGGLSYPAVQYARVWFRVGHSGDKYIHTGRHSLGCITVIEQKRWDALCLSLLKVRKGDAKSVGVLTVVE